MTSMQAALGLAQLERIDELVERKRQIFKRYQSELGDIPGITLNYEVPDTKNTYWMVTVVIDDIFGLQKEVLMTLMSEKDINLPCGMKMTEETVGYVCKALKSVLGCG